MRRRWNGCVGICGIKCFKEALQMYIMMGNAESIYKKDSRGKRNQ